MFLSKCSYKRRTYTGEVSSLMLKELSVDFAIVGHSERRRDFYETEDLIKQKIIAVSTRIRPILYVGEQQKDRRRKNKRLSADHWSS